MAGVRGRSGRPKKDTALKIAQGTFRADRDRPLETLKIPDMSLNPPSELTTAALRMWHRLTPLMIEQGRLTAIDYPMWCELWVEYGRMKLSECDNLDDWKGRKEMEDGSEYEYLLPDYSIHKDARQAWIALAAHFGLSPRTRLGVHAPIETTKSPQTGFGKFL